MQGMLLGVATLGNMGLLMMIQIRALLLFLSVPLARMFPHWFMFSGTSWRTIMDNVGRLLGRGIHWKIVNRHVD